MDDAAIGADALQAGITQDEHYETLVARIQDYGNPARIKDPVLPHHVVEDLSLNERERDQGEPADGSLTARDMEYDQRLTGNVGDALAGIEARTLDRENHASIEAMMRAVPGGGHVHGSSKSGRTREPKRGTKVCRECGLTLCEHIAAGRGRPTFAGDAGRSHLMSVRVSQVVQDALRDRKVSASGGEIIESVVRFALQYNMDPEAAIEGVAELIASLVADAA